MSQLDKIDLKLDGCTPREPAELENNHPTTYEMIDNMAEGAGVWTTTAGHVIAGEGGHRGDDG